MSGLSSILLTGLSALRASQTSMGVTSQNIANANTPGYVRTSVALAPRTSLGLGGGVEVTGIKRAADQFLAAASFLAQASQGAATARSDLLQRAQAEFGDPNTDSSMFASLDQFWSNVTELGVDPSSSLRRDDAVSSLQTTYSEIQRVGTAVQGLIGEADQRIGDAVGQAQSLVNQIASLNSEIRLTQRTGADASSAQNAQSQLIDQLSSIVDIRVSPQDDGSVQVRTGGGALLVGVDAAKLTYTPNTAPFATHGAIALNPDVNATNIEPYLISGEIKGLLQARDQDLPNLAEALGGFASSIADALNKVSNENASSPPVSNLTGRQTGLLGSDSLNFTGKSVIGIVDSDGKLTQRLTVDFDAGTITGEAPATTYNFSNSIDDFTSALNTALGDATPAGSASFTDGKLAVNVGASGGAVIQQDPTDPSDRAGRGFSQFFGLNDLVSRPTPIFFENGISPSDTLGLNSGGALSYQVRDANGRLIASPSVAITGTLASPTATWNDLKTALNDPTTGLGNYGQFSFDSTTGQMSFAPTNGYTISLISDTTTRGTTGVSVSALNGMSAQSTAGRALELNVNDQIVADPTRLAAGKPDLTAALGSRIIEEGDNRGASALLAARDTVRTFGAAGSLSAQTTSLATYSARLAGEAGRMANDASRASAGAAAVASAASDRRSQVEGVSLDDELVKMTTYQNSYSAAARVIQAVQDMFDVLLTIGMHA